jgi:hypothetical protein
MPQDAGRVVPQLVAMLQETNTFIRRGAIEGLGLIGSDAACIALQTAMTTEADNTTKEYFVEALGFCAAYAVLGEPGSAKEPPEVGMTRLLGKLDAVKTGSDSVKKKVFGDWVVLCLKRRTDSHRQEAMATLEKALTSNNPKIAQLAGLLKAVVQPAESKQP